MEDAKYPAEQQTAFAELLGRLEVLRDLRNHIAHGHMLCRIDVHTHRPIVTLFKAKDVDRGYDPDSKHLEFKELRAALTALTEVIEELSAFAGFKPAS